MNSRVYEISSPPLWEEPRDGLLAPVQVDAATGGEVAFVTAIPGWRVSGTARWRDAPNRENLAIRHLRVDPLVQRFRVEHPDGEAHEEDHDLSPEVGLQTNALRKIPLGQILSAIRAAVAGMRGVVDRHGEWKPGTWDVVADPKATSAVVARTSADATRIADSIPPERSVGRPRLSDEFIADIAARIVRLNRERSKSPVADLARELSLERGEEIPVSRARSWAQRARRDGWLIGGVAGAKDAWPSEKLTNWMEERG